MSKDDPMTAYGPDALRARELLLSGDVDDAVAIADRVLESDRYDVGALCVRAAERLTRGDSEGALHWARRAEAEALADAWPRRLAAMALMHLGRFDEASEEADIAVSLDPEVVASLLARIRIDLRCDGVSSQTLEDARAAARLDPDDAETHRLLGAVLLHWNDVDAATAEAREALRIAPDDTAARALLDHIESWRTEVGEDGVRAVQIDRRTHESLPVIHQSLRLTSLGVWALVLGGVVILPARGVDAGIAAAVTSAAAALLIGYCLARLATAIGRPALPIMRSAFRHERYLAWSLACTVTAAALLGVASGLTEPARGYTSVLAFAVLFAPRLITWMFRPRTGDGLTGSS